jgi:hypothetical protein
LNLRQQVIREPLWQPNNNRIASYTADNQSKDCKLRELSKGVVLPQR